MQMIINSKTHGQKIDFLDSVDWDLISPYSWSLAKRNGIFYAEARVNGKNMFLHTFISGFKQTDHIDGNGLNNSRENLRSCNKTQNAQNSKINSRNKTGYKGVTFYKKSGKFYACIRIKGKTKPLGYYINKEEAALAYNQAAVKYFGEFARLNTF